MNLFVSRILSSVCQYYVNFPESVKHKTQTTILRGAWRSFLLTTNHQHQFFFGGGEGARGKRKFLGKEKVLEGENWKNAQKFAILPLLWSNFQHICNFFFFLKTRCKIILFFFGGEGEALVHAPYGAATGYQGSILHFLTHRTQGPATEACNPQNL